MPPRRTVISDHRSEPYKHPSHSPLPGSTQPSKPKQKRHTHTAEEWKILHPVIRKIYIDDDKTVDQVVGILKTDYNFVVGKRKLLDWMKSQAITKYESNSNMRIMYAKRQSHLILEGKKTVITKDGRIINNDRLDRWAARFLSTICLEDYVTAATPEYYTIATPAAAASHDGTNAHENQALKKLFVSEKPVKFAYGFVLDGPDIREPNINHDHQIGVFGLRMISVISENELSSLLDRSLILARDLITTMLVPGPDANGFYKSMRPTPNARVPKVHICYTGHLPLGIQPLAESRVVATLQSSQTCMQLLQLSLADCTRWQGDWYAMTLDEQSLVDHLCTTYFGSLSSFDPAMLYMHIVFLLESPSGPTDTVLTQVSLGVDTRPGPECGMCQRRVVSVDSINENGAVKLNVPLQSAWQGGWAPSDLGVGQGSDTARWEDCVYALRSWFTRKTHCSGFQEDHFGFDDDEDERGWDPMATNTPLVVFQPREADVPVGCCAYNDVCLVCQCTPETDEIFNICHSDLEDTR